MAENPAGEDRISPAEALKIGRGVGLSDAKIKVLLDAGVALGSVQMWGADIPWSPGRGTPRPNIWSARTDPRRARSFLRFDVERLLLLASAEVERPYAELDAQKRTPGRKKGASTIRDRIEKKVIALLADGKLRRSSKVRPFALVFANADAELAKLPLKSIDTVIRGIMREHFRKPAVVSPAIAPRNSKGPR